jgi:Fuc2NAc and GlcNAc transferase
LAHAIAAFAVVGIIGMPEITIGYWSFQSSFMSHIVFALALTWLLNLYNFMDGIDGLAAVEAIFVAGGAILLLWINDTGIVIINWLAIIIAGVAGFLVWNWPPARIFMGDVGSGFLGFFLGVVAIITAQSGDLSIWSWIILLGVFIVDATVTLLRRILRKERWYEAHRSHAYQRLARYYNSHKIVTIGVLVINLLWLLPLAWIADKWRDLGGPIVIIAFIPLIIGTLFPYVSKSKSTHDTE